MTDRPIQLLAAAPPDVDAVVRRINQLRTESLLRFLLEVGRLVVDDLLGGDLEAWRAGEGEVSFRKLCQHPDLDLTVSGLSRAVRLHELDVALREQGMTGGLEALHALSPSHFYTVLGLPFDAQLRLLTEANDARWSTRRIEEVAKRERGSAERAPRRRRKAPRFAETVRRVAALVAEPDEAFGDLDRLDELDDDEALALWRTVVGLRLQLDALERRLQHRVREG